MTYGETRYANKCQLESCKSLELDDADRKINLPKKMNSTQASRYYNTKLFHHWVHDYEYHKNLSTQRIKELVSALMFGNKDRYKEFEELV